MTIRNLSLALITLMGIALPANAQYAWQEYDERVPSKQRLDNNIGYKVEMQSSFSKDKTPLWLTPTSTASARSTSSTATCAAP